jgi:PAS domain S-box-containing protein
MLLERISELEERNYNLERLELTIQRNAELFEALLGASDDGIALTRADGTIIQDVRGILGYPPNSLTGMCLADLAYFEDRNSIVEGYRDLVINRRNQFQTEVRLLKASGASLWVELTITDMLDNPAVLAIVTRYRDLSWRRRGDLARGELSAVIHHTALAIFSVDLGGTIQTWHQGCVDLLGYSLAEILSGHVRMLMPEHGEDQDRAARSAVIESGYATAQESRTLVGRGGKLFPIRLTLAPLVSGGMIQGVTYLISA